MTKQVYLHIGRAKTGTSSIQNYLFDSRDELWNGGVLYPLTGTRGTSHAPLAYALNPKFRNQFDRQSLKSQLNREMHGFDTAIVSSEAFQNITDLSTVAEFFNEYELQLICYLREALDYAQSAYAQRVHATDYAGTFDTFVRANFKPRYENMLTSYSRIVSQSTVRLYDRTRLKNQDIVDDFLSIVGIYPEGSRRLEHNKSLGGNLLYFKRLLNERGLHKLWLYPHLSRLAYSQPRYSAGFCVDGKTSARVRRLLAKENDFLVKMFGEVTFKDFSDRPKFPDLSTLEQDISEILKYLAECGDPRAQDWLAAYQKSGIGKDVGELVGS